MFLTAKTKKEHQIVQHSLTQAERTILGLQSALDTAKSEKQALSDALLEARADCDVARLVFKNMMFFGESFTALQTSQVTAAKLLQEFHMHGKEAVAAFCAGKPMQGMELVAKMEEDSMAVLGALELIAVAGEGNNHLLCHEGKMQ